MILDKLIFNACHSAVAFSCDDELVLTNVDGEPHLFVREAEVPIRRDGSAVYAALILIALILPTVAMVATMCFAAVVLR